jgi:hypothetical protein
MINQPAPPAGHRRPSLPAVDESQGALQTPDGSRRVEAVHCGRHLPAQPRRQRHRRLLHRHPRTAAEARRHRAGPPHRRTMEPTQARSSSGVASGAPPVCESSLRVVEDQSFSGNLVGGVVPHAGSTWSKHAPATGRRLGYAQRSRGPLPGRGRRCPRVIQTMPNEQAHKLQNGGFSVSDLDPTKTVTCVSADHRPHFVGLTGFEPATP